MLRLRITALPGAPPSPSRKPHSLISQNTSQTTLSLSFLLAIAAFTGAASQLGNPNQLSVTFRLTPPRLARNTLGMLLESSIAHTPRLTDRSDKPPAIAAHPPTCAMAKRIPSSTTSNPRSAMGALPDVQHRLQGDRNEFWRRSKTPTQENTL